MDWSLTFVLRDHFTRVVFVGSENLSYKEPTFGPTWKAHVQ